LFGEDNEPQHDPPDFIHPVQLDNREKASMLFKAISKLPENQRIAFTLHVEGVPYQRSRL
jgi:RNA polymerase sigma-70 factor (ECF subfamily)